MVITPSKKTVFITGTSRGIGLTLAEHYVRDGWNVIATCRNPQSAEKLSSLSVWKLLPLDTSDEQAINDTAQALAGVPIDLVINNAGIAEGVTLFDTTKAHLMHQFEINCVGSFLVTRALLPNLKLAVATSGSALVAQISSYLGSMELTTADDNIFHGGVHGYRASKAALNMITRSLAVDLKDERIGFLLLHPGIVATDMTAPMGPAPVSTTQTVEGMAKVIANATLADSGRFISFEGDAMPCVLNTKLVQVRPVSLQKCLSVIMTTQQPKTVLITGASRSIGLTFAAHYIQQGWNVIATARNLETAHKLKELSPWKLLQLDTGDEESILRAATELSSVPIDLLINNAGIYEGGDINETKAALMHQFEVNVAGPFLTTRALLPNLKLAAEANGSAFVVQLSSVFASIRLNSSEGPVAGGFYGYRASKAALNMITKSHTVDLKNDNIGFLLLHPGYVTTDMNDQAGEINAEQSVAGMTKVIAGFTLADSGKFLDYEGQTLPW